MYVSLPRDEHWSLPTITDDLDEPDEHDRIRVATFPKGLSAPAYGPELTGTVADGP